MRQVIWNLLRNAIQASSAGDQVEVRLGENDDHLFLAIADNGPGIAPAARDRLFDAFFTTRSHGVGIGLAVVKRILDDHGFAIEVENGNEAECPRTSHGGTSRAERLPTMARRVNRRGP